MQARQDKIKAKNQKIARQFDLDLDKDEEKDEVSMITTTSSRVANIKNRRAAGL